jgi:uncharacterized damage-inducible protein DinB
MQLITDELNQAMVGDAWHGDSIAALLKNVTSDQARTRPVASAHTIWELVRHMTAWTQEVTRRLAGEPAAEPQLGDWPAPSGQDDAAWSTDVADLLTAHKGLVAAVAPMTPSQLASPMNDQRDAALGTGVSLEVMLHGLAQHHAYHGGQIALLKKATR